jgi:hypothetical protein
MAGMCASKHWRLVVLLLPFISVVLAISECRHLAVLRRRFQPLMSHGIHCAAQDKVNPEM